MALLLDLRASSQPDVQGLGPFWANDGSVNFHSGLGILALLLVFVLKQRRATLNPKEQSCRGESQALAGKLGAGPLPTMCSEPVFSSEAPSFTLPSAGPPAFRASLTAGPLLFQNWVTLLSGYTTTIPASGF